MYDNLLKLGRGWLWKAGFVLSICSHIAFVMARPRMHTTTGGNHMRD